MFILGYISELFFYITLPFFFLERLIHKKSGGWKEKFGYCNNITANDNVIMIHGCSVGEITAIEDLVKRIRNEFPKHKIVVTTSTLTGQDIAKKKLSETADYITFFPFDIPSAVNRFLKQINPSIVLIAETEIWPNFAYACNRKKIPLYIINGRISDNSYNMYKYSKLFFEKILNYYTAIYTQSNEDSEKFISIGMHPDKTKFMGNLKFGITKSAQNIDLGQQNYKVILAGSTHKPENLIVIDTYSKIKNSHSEIKLLIAPRHLERVTEIENLCTKYNLKTGLRSKNDKFTEEIDVIILDTYGELKNMYTVADIAFIGGSFNNTGGHNPLEASICDVPVISGPQIFNFKDIYGILTSSGAAKVVKKPLELYQSLLELIENQNLYQNAKIACSGVFQEQRGAQDFVINIIKAQNN